MTSKQRIQLFTLILFLVVTILAPHFMTGIVSTGFLRPDSQSSVTHITFWQYVTGTWTWDGNTQNLSAWNVLSSIVLFQVTTGAWIISAFYDALIIINGIFLAEFVRGIN